MGVTVEAVGEFYGVKLMRPDIVVAIVNDFDGEDAKYKPSNRAVLPYLDRLDLDREGLAQLRIDIECDIAALDEAYEQLRDYDLDDFKVTDDDGRIVAWFDAFDFTNPTQKTMRQICSAGNVSRERALDIGRRMVLRNRIDGLIIYLSRALGCVNQRIIETRPATHFHLSDTLEGIEIEIDERW